MHDQPKEERIGWNLQIAICTHHSFLLQVRSAQRNDAVLSGTESKCHRLTVNQRWGQVQVSVWGQSTDLRVCLKVSEDKEEEKYWEIEILERKNDTKPLLLASCCWRTNSACYIVAQLYHSLLKEEENGQFHSSQQKDMKQYLLQHLSLISGMGLKEPITFGICSTQVSWHLKGTFDIRRGCNEKCLDDYFMLLYTAHRNWHFVS